MYGFDDYLDGDHVKSLRRSINRAVNPIEGQLWSAINAAAAEHAEDCFDLGFRSGIYNLLVQQGLSIEEADTKAREWVR